MAECMLRRRKGSKKVKLILTGVETSGVHCYVQTLKKTNDYYDNLNAWSGYNESFDTDGEYEVSVGTNIRILWYSEFHSSAYETSYVDQRYIYINGTMASIDGTDTSADGYPRVIKIIEITDSMSTITISPKKVTSGKYIFTDVYVTL